MGDGEDTGKQNRTVDVSQEVELSNKDSIFRLAASFVDHNLQELGNVGVPDKALRSKGSFGN